MSTAFTKLTTASLLAAVSLAVLTHAAGGELGNFGNVGVDQATLVPGSFFWFFVIGGLTVVMAGGISPRPKAVVTSSEPEPDVADDQSEPMTEPLDLQSGAGDESESDGGDESGDQGVLDELVPDELVPDELLPDDLLPEAQLESEPGPPPPPVKPAPDVEDVEDLMFVDDDIEVDGDQPPSR